MRQLQRRLLTGLPKEAVAFFVTFSRFEFALKQSGYVQGPKKKVGRDARADWDALAKALGKSFFNEVQASRKADTLINSPPRKQIVKREKLEWGAQEPPIKNTKELFLAVRRVRNNLFHGGKFARGYAYDSSRDLKLLDAALCVLECALEKSPLLNRIFAAML